MFVHKKANIFLHKQLDKQFPTRDKRLFYIKVLSTNAYVLVQHL